MARCFMNLSRWWVSISYQETILTCKTANARFLALLIHSVNYNTSSLHTQTHTEDDLTLELATASTPSAPTVANLL